MSLTPVIHNYRELTCTSSASNTGGMRPKYSCLIQCKFLFQHLLESVCSNDSFPSQIIPTGAGSIDPLCKGQKVVHLIMLGCSSHPVLMVSTVSDEATLARKWSPALSPWAMNTFFFVRTIPLIRTLGVLSADWGWTGNTREPSRFGERTTGHKLRLRGEMQGIRLEDKIMNASSVLLTKLLLKGSTIIVELSLTRRRNERRHLTKGHYLQTFLLGPGAMKT